MAIAQVPWCLPALWLPLSLYAPAVRAFIDINDPTFIQDCVTEHNKFRSRVSPPATNMFAMTWDEALAKSARAWSKVCIFKHNPSLKKKGTVHPTFFPVGENIYISSGRFSAKAAIKRWHDEVFDFNYNTNTCKSRRVCGHYTQLAWAKSYKVGCAVSDCPRGIKSSGIKGPGVNFVCNYAPSGNYIATLPYISGRSCSTCSPSCRNNLCRDIKRDAIKKYPNWNPTYGSASVSSCDQLLLLASIIVIYVLE
ncbi:GLIPR1-like protein 1 [Cetorhinus maximus]